MEIPLEEEELGIWTAPVTQEQFNSLLLALDGISFEKKEENDITRSKNAMVFSGGHGHSGVSVGGMGSSGSNWRPAKEEQKPFSVDNPPKKFATYWYLDITGEHDRKYQLKNASYESDSDFDTNNLSIGNCFHTRELAEAALSRVLQALKS